MKRLTKRDIPRKYFHISRSWVILKLISIWLSIVFMILTAMTVDSVVVKAMIFVLIGTLQYHLNILGHDGIHFCLASDRKINDFIARWLIQAPIFSPFGLLRKNHLNHHSTLGSYLDADRQYYEVEKYSSRFSFFIYLVSSFFGGMSVGIAKKIFCSSKVKGNKNIALYRENLRDILSILGVQCFIFLAFCSVHSCFTYIIFWFFPAFTIMFGLNVTRSCLEHSLSSDFTDSSRLQSFKPGLIERFFLSPYSMNRHAEHHLFPTIPARNLEEFSLFLKGSGFEIKEYPSYMEKLRYVLSRIRSFEVLHSKG